MTVAAGCGGSADHPNYVQFEADGEETLGLTSGDPMAPADWKAIGDGMCGEVRGNMKPNDIVYFEEYALSGRGVHATDAGTSALIADAITDLCPSAEANFNREVGSGQ